MNVSVLNEDNNATFDVNRSYAVQRHYDHYDPVNLTVDVIVYVALTLGIPGNILSAIIWLRRHLNRENPSAIYLAVLAINDLVFLIVDGAAILLFRYVPDSGHSHVLHRCLLYLNSCAGVFETLLLLSFSIVRLIAIRCPLQVC